MQWRTFYLIVVTLSGIVSLGTVAQWLSVRLAMGGVIGYMPNGDFRLFTAGSLFLLVGLVLTTQKLSSVRATSGSGCSARS